jgi:hypothetical protein
LVFVTICFRISNRLKSNDPEVREGAVRDYEHAARAPEGFAAALMGTHRAAARIALLRGDRLNSWERDFLASLTRIANRSQKQLAVLASICAKASAEERPSAPVGGAAHQVRMSDG